MTTPNEELIAELHKCAVTSLSFAPKHIPDSLYSIVANALQSQAERIKELETVPMKYRRKQFNAELQEENARLRAQIAEIEKTDPVKLTYAGSGLTAGGQHFMTYQYTYDIGQSYPKQLFTRPMPAQREPIVDRAELQDEWVVLPMPTLSTTYGHFLQGIQYAEEHHGITKKATP